MVFQIVGGDASAGIHDNGSDRILCSCRRPDQANNVCWEAELHLGIPNTGWLTTAFARHLN